MSDVLQLATKYRSRLKAELAKVEDFLRMAEELSKGGDLEARMPFARTSAEAAKPNGEAEAQAPAKAEAEAKPTPKPLGEAKTPFDRFRANGG